ncbi:hypothetical protein EW145_g3033 [Phellinidium pouzarii]|uniref:Mitochondrial carrier n=1 Tax=Phellinidium pouzarii TaxID=167371 RepID=A0A4S4L8V3_9AGAM|nr:hypothetical protein EW145_g3033 [Phellinidium pouzarii]
MGNVDNATTSKKKQIDPVVDFVAGTIAGIAGLAIAYPFDTVKVRFQSPETSVKYRSTFHAFSTIVREEKFKGLYKGIVSPMLSSAPLNGLVFSSYRFFMRVQLKSENDEPTITQIGVAGVGSGIVASRILLRADQRPALDIFRRNGIRGLYRGLTATALRDVGYGAYFATYEAACRYFSRPAPRDSSLGRPIDRATERPLGNPTTSPIDHSSLLSEVESERVKLSWPALLLSGAMAGISGWIARFAFDVVKTRVQSVDYCPSGPGQKSASYPSQDINITTAPTSSSTSTITHPYRNTLSTIVYSYRTEGVRFFFRGMAPTLMRAIPVNMATFGVFEGVVHLLS